MEIGEQLNRQRVKHIVSSYQLDGDEAELFDSYLINLLNAYPSPLVELALVEKLVDNWVNVPMLRGCQFLAQVDEQLQSWEGHEIASTITPEQFQQITGLDPSPIFGPVGVPQPSTRPLGTGY